MRAGRVRTAAGRTGAAIAAIALAGLLASCGRGGAGDAAETAVPDDTPADAAAPEFASPTLAAVKRRGRLNCGVHEGLVGFAYTDNRGEWRGFDVDSLKLIE